MRRLAFLLAAPLFLAACSAASAPAAAPRAGGVGGATAQGVDSAQVGSAPAAVPAPNAVAAPKEGIPNPVAFNADRNLILTANISMRAKDPWATIEKAHMIVASRAPG